MAISPNPTGSLLLRSFRHRNFRLFFAGQFISLTGTWMQSVAVSWLVYRLTGSSMALGLVGFASHIPVFLFGLFGGCLADRGNKRAILIAAQAAAMLQALALAALTLSGTANVWLVVSLATFLGLVNAVDMPTRQAFVVDMVGREDLHNAIALNSSMFNSARVVGPALAGVLVAAIGEGWCFLVNGLSYLAVIAALAAMRLPPSQPSCGSGSVSGHVRQGLAYAWGDRSVRSILGSLIITSLFASSYMVLLPVVVNTVLGHGAQALGFLMAATGVGSVAAALLLALRQKSRGLSRWRIVSGLGVGLVMVAFAFSQTFWLSVCLSMIMGFCLIFFFAASNTMLQLRSPDAMRGRIMSLYSVTLVGMAPFGSLLAGAAASLLDAPTTIALAGGLCVAGVALSTILDREPGQERPA
ncbi:putative transporter [Desulfovibrio sp. DV]|uniref:MFS transporter n=1 Tax=Desulfovibrio sp. DV TaxID=1844708 RepID=UPI00094B9D22|nr:MFS transporter [Desulfovibrio sp. DV]OLN31114.1 putative transporter [Desulfovibrio sp. DV]